MSDKITDGLPLATRSWTLTFALNGVANDPSAITIVVTREHGGVPVEVERLSKTDLDRTATGVYTLTITPDNSGLFEVQIYTSGDDFTVHESIKFSVPMPVGAYP